jgi:hypothetical protein
MTHSALHSITGVRLRCDRHLPRGITVLRRVIAAAFAVFACLTAAAVTGPAAHAGGPFYVDCPIAEGPSDCTGGPIGQP